jgi:hypothetical protein
VRIAILEDDADQLELLQCWIRDTGHTSDGDREFERAIAESGRVVLPVLMEMPRLGGQALETMPLPGPTAAVSALGYAHVELSIRTALHAACTVTRGSVRHIGDIWLSS